MYRVRELDREELLASAAGGGATDEGGDFVFELRVEARQKDNPVKSAVAAVEVAVEDANDEAPAFPVAAYNATVAESVPEGLELVRFQAKDPDKVS